MRDPSRALAHRLRHLLPGVVAVGLLLAVPSLGSQVQTPTTFASRIAQLSERGGYFDTDNLISNEKSYLHVVPDLRSSGLAGGAYLGVGPDQNFSYIAQVKPAIAFIVDLRRDNLLLHLLFKALFTMADSRVEYLSLLFGRPVPPRADEWRSREIERLVAYIDGVRPSDQATASLKARIETTIKAFGVPLSAADLATIDRFHRRFITAGLSLKFETTGRPPQWYYPDYRQLMLETDRNGRHWNFLAAEDDYQFVRSLERRDLVIPVVGDLAGSTAMAGIAKLMTERGDTLGAYYASNVEFYLFSDGTYPKFIENLSSLPHTDRSVIIRSAFGTNAVDPAPGYYMSSSLQPVDQLLQGYANGRYRRYFELTGTLTR